MTWSVAARRVGELPAGKTPLRGTHVRWVMCCLRLSARANLRIAFLRPVRGDVDVDVGGVHAAGAAD